MLTDRLALLEPACLSTFLPYIAIDFRGILAFDPCHSLCAPNARCDTRLSFPLPLSTWSWVEWGIDTVETIDDTFRIGGAAAQCHHTGALCQRSQSSDYRKSRDGMLC